MVWREVLGGCVVSFEGRWRCVKGGGERVMGDWEVSCAGTSSCGLIYGLIEGSGGTFLNELGYVWIEFTG